MVRYLNRSWLDPHIKAIRAAADALEQNLLPDHHSGTASYWYGRAERAEAKLTAIKEVCTRWDNDSLIEFILEDEKDEQGNPSNPP